MALLTTLLEWTSGPWLPIVAGAAVLYYVISSVLAWRRLRHFNGPFLASFSYTWIVPLLRSGEMAERFAAVGERYGSGSPSSTVRIGPNELMTSDPDVIRRVSGARGKYTRSDWYRLTTMDPYEEAMFNTLDTATHDRIKAQTAAGYAGKDNPNLEEEIDSVVAEVVSKLRTKYAAKTPQERGKMPMVDLARMAQFFTLDSICKVAFGYEFGHVREERDIYGHIEMFDEVSAPVVLVSGIPLLRAIMASDLVLKLAGPKPGDKKGLGRIMAFVPPSFTPVTWGTRVELTRRVRNTSALGERLSRSGSRRTRQSGKTCWCVPPASSRGKKKKKSKDAKSDLWNNQGSFIRHGMTERQCYTESLFQIAAGSDTTATAIRATLLYIMTTPRAYHALQAEIDGAIKAGKISNPATNAEANNLPYLQVCLSHSLTHSTRSYNKTDADDGMRARQGVILEGLRLFPPFTGLVYKVVPPEGDTIDGKPVPGGTLVAPNVWAIGRHRGVFGPDADVFRPERWLEVDAAERAEMRRVAEMVFGYGRWYVQFSPSSLSLFNCPASIICVSLFLSYPPVPFSLSLLTFLWLSPFRLGQLGVRRAAD